MVGGKHPGASPGPFPSRDPELDDMNPHPRRSGNSHIRRFLATGSLLFNLTESNGILFILPLLPGLSTARSLERPRFLSSHPVGEGMPFRLEREGQWHTTFHEQVTHFQKVLGKRQSRLLNPAANCCLAKETICS